MAELQEIAHTVTTLANPGMKPKDLFAAVRKRHPKATKKEISRAAFFAMILSSEADPGKAAKAQELALASRGVGEDGADDLPVLGKSDRKAAKRKQAPSGRVAHDRSEAAGSER